MIKVVFLQLFEQYKKGQTYNLERTLANGLCKRDICVPFTVHQKMLKEEEQKVKEAAKKKAAKEKADKEKADLLLKKKSEKKTADSKKAFKRSKAIK